MLNFINSIIQFHLTKCDINVFFLVYVWNCLQNVLSNTLCINSIFTNSELERPTCRRFI